MCTHTHENDTTYPSILSGLHAKAGVDRGTSRGREALVEHDEMKPYRQGK